MLKYFTNLGYCLEVVIKNLMQIKKLQEEISKMENKEVKIKDTSEENIKVFEDYGKDN